MVSDSPAIRRDTALSIRGPQELGGLAIWPAFGETMHMGVSIRTHLWVWWARIAIEQERNARRSRSAAVLLTINGDGFGEHLHAETLASMIGITACSHSLDALYGSIRDTTSPVKAEKRWSHILESIKGAFVINGSVGGGRWATELEWLFDLRDAAVHYAEAQNPPVPHPTGTSTGKESVYYSLEPTRRAVDLLIDVLSTCVSNPRPTRTEWAARMRPSVDALVTFRKSTD